MYDRLLLFISLMGHLATAVCKWRVGSGGRKSATTCVNEQEKSQHLNRVFKGDNSRGKMEAQSFSQWMMVSTLMGIFVGLGAAGVMLASIL